VLGITAQVNTEKFRSESDASRIGGFALLDLYARRGNVNIAEIGLSGRIDYRGNLSKIFLIVESEYGWQDKKQYSDEALLHLRYLHDVTPNLKPELFIQGDYNKARLLLSRMLGGGGVRIRLLQRVNSSYWFGISIFKEYESYNLPSTAIHPKETHTIRWNNYLSFRYAKSEIFELSGVLYYQPSISAFNDHRILNENFLRINFTRRFSLTLSINFRFDSKPPDEIETLDTRVRIGLGYNL
jgi:hypothetical protein